MKLYADYLPFDADDFLTDPVFREWVARPVPEIDAYWQGLLKTHPHLRSPFEQARLLAQSMQATWTPFSDTYTDALYQQVRAALSANQPPAQTNRIIRLVPRWAYASAASLVLMLGLSGYWYFFREQLIRTDNAELTTVTLYDGSVVTLNANSQLRLPGRVAWREQRQVWLSGEGSFAVRKQPGDRSSSFRKFTVHTYRADVVVLGTHFTVYTRPQRTQVLLEEGRIVLTDPTTHQTQTMQPGQLVSYTNQRPAPQIARLAPDRQRPLTAWRENRLVFDNASMDELAQRFREVYGLELVLRDDAFARQEFRGELPVDNIDNALLIISETFGLKPVRQGEQVYFVAN
ncbi:MAG: FecR domain-containing protein [Rudanella sp.]|nr:FecR domain-containing protein [Rudanella sp.]